MEKYVTRWKDPVAPRFTPLKTKKKLHFITLNYIPNYILHPKFWIFIQVNSKFDIVVQSVTNVILYGAKYAFKKFKGAKCNLRYRLGW